METPVLGSVPFPVHSLRENLYKEGRFPLTFSFKDFCFSVGFTTVSPLVGQDTVIMDACSQGCCSFSVSQKAKKGTVNHEHPPKQSTQLVCAFQFPMPPSYQQGTRPSVEQIKVD